MLEFDWKWHDLSDFEANFPQRVIFLSQNFKTCQTSNHKHTACQFWIESFTTCQILNQIIQNLSDFESKFQNRVWFRIKLLQRVKLPIEKKYNVSAMESWNYNVSIFESKFFNVSDFDSKFLQRVRFKIEKKVSEVGRKITTILDFESSIYTLTHFKSNQLQRVTFCNERFTTCQILQQNIKIRQILTQQLYNVSDFVSTKLQRVQIWMEILQRVWVCRSK